MDLKLQQAIVATRAGRTDVAQNLLTQLISEKPDDAHAWFLLGHIIDSKDRQLRYLQKAVELDPHNPVAKKQVALLTASAVPVPVITQEEMKAMTAGADQGTQAADSQPATRATTERITTEPDMPQTAAQLPEWLQDLDSKKLENQQPAKSERDEWLIAAGTPKREARDSEQKARILHIPKDISQASSSSERSREEVWLLRILAFLVVLAAIVLGFLVLLIMF